MRKNFPNAQQLSGRRCWGADKVFGTLYYRVCSLYGRKTSTIHLAWYRYLAHWCLFSPKLTWRYVTGSLKQFSARVPKTYTFKKPYQVRVLIFRLLTTTLPPLFYILALNSDFHKRIKWFISPPKNNIIYPLVTWICRLMAIFSNAFQFSCFFICNLESGQIVMVPKSSK